MLETSFKYRMGVGYAGAVNRDSQSTIEAIPAGDNMPDYGSPVKMQDGKVVAIEAATDEVYGIFVRPFPTHSSADLQYQGVSHSIANVLVRGYIVVKANGDVARNGDVYFDASGNLSSDDAGTAINARFMGAATSGESVEIAYNI